MKIKLKKKDIPNRTTKELMDLWTKIRNQPVGDPDEDYPIEYFWIRDELNKRT